MSETHAKTCAACVHRLAALPSLCGLHKNRFGAPRLAVPLRAELGPCGPEGAFWQGHQAARPAAVIIPFPKPHRVSA